MSTACIYEVRIRHARLQPFYNTFQHGTYMWLFDLDCPPRLRRPMQSLARYRPGDHVDVRTQLREAGIECGRIRLLTNLRVLGYVFNPISIYWCYDQEDQLIAHVAEVHNTYGDRHAYVLPVEPGRRESATGDSATGDSATRDSATGESSVDKEITVSPFYPVDGTYRLRIGAPGDTLSVSVSLDRGDDLPFVASLFGHRRPARAATIIRHVLRYPAAPLRNRLRIQLEGLRLWRRGLEVQPR